MRSRGGPGARPIVNIEMAVRASMKLVDSDGNFSRDIDAPENDRASVSEENLNQIFRF
jgi:hypothetical protein